jgi:enoyl-CoA hydratase/carnithine racemase
MRRAVSGHTDLLELRRERDAHLVREYFGTLYQLPLLLRGYSKPFAAFINGAAVNAGAALAVHSPLPIATDTSVFAVPAAGAYALTLTSCEEENGD